MFNTYIFNHERVYFELIDLIISLDSKLSGDRSRLFCYAYLFIIAIFKQIYEVFMSVNTSYTTYVPGKPLEQQFETLAPPKRAEVDVSDMIIGAPPYKV